MYLIANKCFKHEWRKRQFFPFFLYHLILMTSKIHGKMEISSQSSQYFIDLWPFTDDFGPLRVDKGQESSLKWLSAVIKKMRAWKRLRHFHEFLSCNHLNPMKGIKFWVIIAMKERERDKTEKALRDMILKWAHWWIGIQSCVCLHLVHHKSKQPL